jgi:hypothetical protein
MVNPNVCVSDKLLGIPHPYSYCVKHSEEMVPTNFTKGGLTLKNTSKVLSGLFDYVEYLTIDADVGTKNICKTNKGKGIIGNKYVLKTNIKCRAINQDGTTISGEHYLHKYIDNSTSLGGLITGGTPQNDVNGLIPATFASAGKIGGNVLDIVNAFSGDTNPYCMKVKMQCHVINSKNSALNYRGISPDVYLSLDDIEDIDETLFLNKRKPIIPNIPKVVEPPVEPTQPLAGGAGAGGAGAGGAGGAGAGGAGGTGGAGTGGTTPGLIPPRATPRAGFTNIIDNIIYQNTDKIQSVTAVENAINQINFQDEFLIKTYYVGFSILLIIIIFKLINKKY